MKKLALIALTLGLGTALSAPALQAQAPSQIVAPKVIPAWSDPAAIPLGTGSLGTTPENWELSDGKRVVRNVTSATLVPVLPDPAKATGAAVIVAPGGAYMMLSIDNEGYDVARFLADRGIAAFVLKYRVRPTPADPAGFFAEMGKMMGAAARAAPPAGAPGSAPRALGFQPAVDDAAAAVRLLRARAAEWHVDPARVGFVGFSAGAMTALSVGLTPDKASRPDFIAPIYGPMGAIEVPADAPPLFTAIAADDKLLFGSGDMGIIKSWRAAKRPFEVHVFESGGHGFGMRVQGKPSDLWAEEFYKWMQSRGLLKR